MSFPVWVWERRPGGRGGGKSCNTGNVHRNNCFLLLKAARSNKISSYAHTLTLKTHNYTPFHKPSKLADLGTSYRPISLLYLAVKALERLLQPGLYSLPFSSNQHGFRPNHSTVSALLPLAHNIAQGFKLPFPPLRLSTMAIDLTKAFDMINHTIHIRAFTLSSLSNNIKLWLCAYLKGRIASCRNKFTLSPSFHARVGVSQSACISPTLFNFFVSTFPQADDFLTSTYADDFTV